MNRCTTASLNRRLFGSIALAAAASASLLAQAQDYAAQRGEWPIVALDDLASELDRNHQGRVLELLKTSGAQIFVSGTEVPVALEASRAELTRFHVEQGVVRRV